MQVYRRSQHCSSHRNTHKTQAIMELRQAKPLSANCCSWIITLMMLITSPSLLCAEPDTQIFRVDPLALLSGTLRTYQRAGCDRELVTLSCPRGTSISIEIAQYGRSGDANERNLCPASTEDALDISIPGTEIEIKAPESCTWPNALQYSLLQTVVEACQKKRHCKFLASPKTFGGDPCPGQRKFVEVAYKCRPYEFRSKIACENDVIQLICNPYSRIAIYSANYGRTEYESLQCAQPQGVKEENCLASYATETVMQKCHGRRKCTLSADSTTFGKPCRPDSRMYLKVVYTCVPRKVLKDRFEAAPEPDEPLQSDLEQDQDELYDEDQFFRESDAAPPGPAPKLQGGPTNGRVSDVPGYAGTSSSSSTPASPPRSIHDIMDDSDFSFGENQEKFYLYLIVAVTVAILLCVSIVIGRLVVQRRRTAKDGDDKFQTSNTGETTLPNGFTDDISEIDADIDLQTPLPVPSVSRSDSNQTCLPFACSLHAFTLPASCAGRLFNDCRPTTNAPTTRNDCIATRQSYGPYTPSPGPYGNLGPSNISHTSTTMLVPPCSMGTIMSTSQPPGYLGGPINIMPSQLGSSIGTIRTPLAAMTTLPRPHQPSQQLPPGFLGGSVIGTQTLRRLSSDHDGNTPRSLSRGATNAQYYYG
ncbi:protein eva-1-like isoform X1 [Anopheles merus]|uniref:protein eva-1-like isoform X1 n=1 Tax=Anopheles merus TaxID=30066 RepID=UPI001BE48803|nr:protein eva-1-like isoform X1 [Anopheles merus]XP_041788680.1 protein eva-1-like isoform X1 [Anopheles merus]XP_041788681.1 protein eva-1-like isoform X1 [Anopheles merus]XP_041788682.1 protein eva-1-like isoform X1 [Anopheles merus]XP_041788683.1 protein eva-1-like isoform X1 [Anopheles merus]